MAITLVQQRTASAGSGTSLSLAYNGAVTPGNTLIAAATAPGNVRTINAFSDNQFGAWTAAVSSNVNNLAAIYYLPTPVTSSVTPTVTVSYNSGTAPGLTITEWSGLSQLVDQIGNAHGFGTSSLSVSTSSATTAPVELVMVCASTQTTGHTFTQGAGYTPLGSSSTIGTEYAISSSASTQTATMTTEAAVNFEIVVATFFPAITSQPFVTRRYVHYYT